MIVNTIYILILSDFLVQNKYFLGIPKNVRFGLNI